MENNERSDKEVTLLGHQFGCNSEKCWVRMGIITVTMMTGFTLSMTVASANTQTAATSTSASLAISQTTQAVSSAGAINSGEKGVGTLAGSDGASTEQAAGLTNLDEKTVDTSGDLNGTPVTPAPAPEATTADYVFTQNGENYTISGYNGNATSLNLPSTYGERSVTEIGEGAFNNKNISGAVTIPNSITKIDSNAFANNNITTLDLGTGVKSIGDDAFSLKQDDTNPDRGISSVNIPDSVISIGDRAFANNQIKQLELGDSASNSSLNTIGADAFSGNQISSAVIIPDKVTSIGDRAFANNDITTLDLGKSVKTIGDDAFSRNTKTNSHNNISTVVIPDSVTSIGAWAFANDNIKQLQFGNSASGSNANIETIGAGAFSGNSLSGIVTIPKSVKSVGQDGFDSSVSVVAKDVDGNYWQPAMDQNGKVSYTLLTDYDYALNSDGTYTIKSYTDNLQKYLGTESKDGQITNLTLPSTYNGEKVTGIADNVFNQDFSHKNITGIVTIPNSIINIGIGAFANNDITTLDLGKSVKTIGDDAFSIKNTEKNPERGISSTVTIPDSVTSIGQNAFTNNNISGLILGQNVQIIGVDAFSGNNISGAITIPDSVTSIGMNAFANNQIRTVVLGQKVDTIGPNAFDGSTIVAKDMDDNYWQPVMDQNGKVTSYTQLTDYSYTPNSDGTYTITGYTGSLKNYLGTESKNNQLTNLTLPSTYNGEKVTGIGAYSFNGKNISGTVTIPDTVTSIGQDAFTKNTISSVKLGSSVRTIDQDAFSVNQISGSITIPDSVTSIGVRAFAENWISGVKLGNHVQIIGNDAFARDKNLPNTSHNQISGTVVIPDSVISVGARAFANNQISQLQFVDSTSKLEAIGVDAFSGNQISGTLTIPNSVNVISMNAFANNQITALVLGQNIKEIGLYAFDSNDISKIASAKSMVSDQYLRGQHAIVLVPVNVKGNQILDVKAAIEKAVRGSNITGFELSDNLTFTDSQGKVWSYNAVTDTLADSSGQITADNLIFQLSSTGVGSYGTNELIFMVNKSDTPVTPAKPGNNTGEPNTPTQPGHQTSDVPPVTTPSTPNQLVTNTTGTVTPYTPNATTVPTAPKQSHTTTFTTNRSHIRHQQGTMEKGHTASQMEEQTEETEQREMTNSLPVTTTSRHGDRQTVVTGHQTTKVMLPQTDEGSSVKSSLIGTILLSILSWFGFARRKHEND